MRHRVILLNGPSSSGKSTLAEALRRAILDARNESFRVVSIDQHLAMTPDDPIEEDDVYAVNPLICAAAAEALTAGQGVIVDHVITSERIFRQLKDALKAADVLTVHVTCSRETLIRREKDRGDRCPGSAEASFDWLYPRDGYDVTIDTTERAAQENARDILSRM